MPNINNTPTQEKIIQEISIRGGGILQSIRQSDNSKLHEGDLVFMYPMIVDTTLDRKWGDLLRDFVTVLFTNRIKQSNVLNIVSDATSPGAITSGGKSINPAQALRGSLGSGNIQEPDDSSGLFQGDIDASKRYDYSDVLGKLRAYIGNQIENDPQYSDLRPMISEVIAQNLIPIPIIIGTKKLKIHSSALYWILFIAASQNESLGDIGGGNLNKIDRLMRQIDDKNYEKFMRGLVKETELEDTRRLTKLITDTQDGVGRAVHKFRMVLNKNTMAEEMPVVPNTAFLSSAITNRAAAQANLGRRSAVSYRTFVANEVIGLLQSITHAILPPTEIDISSKLTAFIDDVSGQNATDTAYTAMYGYILKNFQNSHTNSSDDNIDKLDVLIARSTDMCKQNKEIDVTKIFADIANLDFSLLGGGKKLAIFTENLVRAGSSLAGLSKTLNAFLSELGGSEVNGFLSKRKDKIRGAVENYFESGWENNQGITSQSTQPGGTTVGGAIWILTPNPGSVSVRSLFDSDRFKQLTGGSGNQREFEKNMYNTLTEILFFLFLFCFFSFYCDYLKEVEAEVTLQKQDSTSFPNYVLVLRMEYISRIFWGLASKNFRLDVAEEEDEEEKKKFEEKTLAWYKLWGEKTADSAKDDFEKKLDSKMKSLLTSTQKSVYNNKEGNVEDKVEYIYTSLSNDISRMGSPFDKSELENIKNFISDTPAKRKQSRDKTNDPSFGVSSAADTTKQIMLIQKRLNIPNIIVVDEKNRKVYYKLMFMNRVLNLDEGTLSSYISNQKNILKAF